MKNNALEDIRTRTKEDLKEKLAMYKRCVIPRCTGFGKTWLLSEIAKDYSSVLYLYPTDIIKKTVVNAIDETWAEDDEARFTQSIKEEVNEDLGYTPDYKNIKFMSYHKLAQRTKSEIEAFPKYEAVILDEVHRTGGAKTKRNVLWLMYFNKDTYFIGATATPDRSDTFDVIAEFFKGICVFPYTLHDAIQDGIIKMPYYIYCTYDVKKELQETARTAGQDENNEAVKEVIKSALFESSHIYNLPNIIRDTTEKYVKRKSYMKYIVFFSRISRVNTSMDEVVSWFSEAFPDYTINTLVVTSENSTTKNNLNNLNLQHKRKRIDLIACVDMLNMSYHVEDLTGIIMYRCTKSPIIYIQQFGRSLSAGSKNPCMVYDVVDNLHRKSMFRVSPNHKGRKKGHANLTKMERVERLYNEVKDELSEKDSDLMRGFIENTLEAEDKVAFEALWRKVNDITEEDIYAIDHLATYKELIAKTVEEVKYIRIKRAVEEYFRIQQMKCGRPIPKTLTELQKMKDLPPKLQIFIDWIKGITEEDVLHYVLKPDSIEEIDDKKIQKGIKESMLY